MKRIIILLVLLLAAASLLLADDLRCATCGRTIKQSKHYLEYEGRAYCSEACFQAALPKCATCGKVVAGGKKQGEFLKYKGKIYCSQACFEAALPQCAVCGKPVNGGIIVDGKHYCNAHCRRQSLPQCTVCGKPVDGGLRDPLDPDKAYCSQECFSTTLPACDICGARMQSWRTMEDRKYCQECAALPRCWSCGHPGASLPLADGRTLCPDCARGAVFDTAAARALFARARRELSDRLGLSTGHQIGFHLVDLNGLSRAAKAIKTSERGFYHYAAVIRESGRRRTVEKETFDIYVLSGLRPAEFLDVAVHELAHDVQQARFPRLTDRITREGFAEYVASLMATAWGNERLNETRLRNEVKDYVTGYQRMTAVAKDGGLPAVLAHLEKLNGRARAK